jgi:2-polyprenyl-3-methyl-5-hydroxy-6-metoxy-1,4-benzoquinol methylase
VGCGTGRVVERLRTLGLEVIGADGDAPMLRFARDQALSAAPELRRFFAALAAQLREKSTDG